MMTQKTQIPKKGQSQSQRLKNQQRIRRRKGLFKKVKEYSIICDSDVFMILRSRKDGQIYTLTSDSIEQWLLTLQQLETIYPAPIRKSLEDVACKDINPISMNH
ncbi:hypothetical protein VTN96DRAFT_7431 [Rasamsonia emersonii]